jgi:uncharacterized protein YjbJ (UPF0337 family)
MTCDRIEGRCKQYCGWIMENWGRLVHDDAMIIRGKREQLFGVIQERYRISRKEAETQVNEFSLSLWSAGCEQESKVLPGDREQTRDSGRR